MLANLLTVVPELRSFAQLEVKVVMNKVSGHCLGRAREAARASPEVAREQWPRAHSKARAAELPELRGFAPAGGQGGGEQGDSGGRCPAR